MGHDNDGDSARREIDAQDGIKDVSKRTGIDELCSDLSVNDSERRTLMSCAKSFHAPADDCELLTWTMTSNRLVATALQSTDADLYVLVYG